MKVSIEIDDKKLLNRLASYKNIGIEKIVTDATAFAQREAKNNCPVDTGTLRSSIHMKVENYANYVVGTVYTNTSYAIYVEFGTGQRGQGTYPYQSKVSPVYSSKKSWVYTPDGENFYTSRGQVAQPYMYPALRQTREYIKSVFGDLIKNGG